MKIAPRSVSILLASLLLGAISLPSLQASAISGASLSYKFSDNNTPGGPTYNWKEISSTGTKVEPLSAYDFTNNVRTIPLGFSFTLGNNTFSSVVFNGYSLTRDGFLSTCSECWTIAPLLTPLYPADYFPDFPYSPYPWEKSPVSYYYKTIGTAPNRQFIFEWSNVRTAVGVPGPYGGSASIPSPSGVTFEVILYETSNKIMFQYKDMDFGDAIYFNYPYATNYVPQDNGANARVYISDSSGSTEYSVFDPIITDGLAIRFQPISQPPVVGAGADQHVKSREQVYLNGVASDPDGDPLTYTWTQIKGPTTVTMIGEDTGAMNFMAPDVTDKDVFVFKLTVSDGALKASDTVKVVVTQTCDDVELDATEENLHSLMGVALSFGYDVAADNLQYYLDGTGGTKEMSVDWLRSFKRVTNAEKDIHQLFVTNAGNEKSGGSILKAALALNDGETVTFTDNWQKQIYGASPTELFYASGNSLLDADGTFVLTRSGDVITVTGNVQYNWHDPYNWDNGKFVVFPNGVIVYDKDVKQLELCRGAKDYTMVATWQQSLSGTIENVGNDLFPVWTIFVDWSGP